uniref:hypothetical protein n=1 Tax=Prevotellamassilia timonensis TaxID=1852370 RepID=UPI004029EB5A
MDTKQTGKIKAIEHKAYEVYKEIDALVVQLQKEKVGWEEIEELKLARDTSCNVVDALQYVREEFGGNDYEP